MAVVLFDAFTALDAYGPIAAFGATRATRPDGTLHRFFEIFTIANAPGPVRSGEGVATHADYAFADAPAYDIVLVPGGFGTRKVIADERFLERLRAASQRAQVTTTVCTGSALQISTDIPMCRSWRRCWRTFHQRQSTTSRTPGRRPLNTSG